MSATLKEYVDLIYVINLPDHKHRLQYFFSQVDNELRNNIQIFRAVNGKKLDIRTIDESLITDKGKKSIQKEKRRYGIDLTYGAIGCAMSHYLILKETSKNSKPTVIFEDDIDIQTNISIQIKKLLNISHAFDIIYLGIHDISSHIKSNRIDNLFYKPKGMICGTFGMIVSPSGADKILKTIFPITMQIDSEITKHQNKLNLLCCNNPLVKHTLKFGTSIQGKNGLKTFVYNHEHY